MTLVHVPQALPTLISTFVSINEIKVELFIPLTIIYTSKTLLSLNSSDYSV